MIVGLADWQNNCNFAIKFDDVSKLNLVKKFMVEGLSTWYQAAHDDEEIESRYFSKEEVKAFYESGYAEPTSELLDRYGIAHEVVNLEYDEDDECTTECDEVIWY